MKILSINNFTVKLLSEHKKKYTVKLGDLTRLVLKHISDVYHTQRQINNTFNMLCDSFEALEINLQPLKYTY